MEITATLVKELRERTGIWMMECKKALVTANWDMELAIEELRKKWLSKASSKADRETFEWAIKIVTEWNKAYIVSVSCETDFLANSDRYKDMLNSVVDCLKANKSIEDAQEMINKDYSLEMWENLQIRDYQKVEGSSVWAYVHSNNKLASLVVAKVADLEDKLKQVAMHITAIKPDFLYATDISQDVIDKEKSIQLEIMKNDPKMAGKPDEVLLKIIDGKMWKFVEDVTLLEQDFVINPSQKVKDFIGSDTLTSFYRFTI